MIENHQTSCTFQNDDTWKNLLLLGTKRRKIRRNVRGNAMEYGWIRIHNLLVCCATKISPEFRRIALALSRRICRKLSTEDEKLNDEGRAGRFSIIFSPICKT